LLKLHYAAIQYSVRVHHVATEIQERDSHISYQALAIIAMRAVTIHRAILDLCIGGWTPVNGILVRTLADLYANTLAIAMKPEDVEFMAFRYLMNFQLGRLRDTSLLKEIREQHRAEIDNVIANAPKLDRERVATFIDSYKPSNYWYQPEYSSPMDVLNKTEGDMKFMYRVFSGAVHGGTVGLGFLDDAPDDFDVNPRNHPRRNRLAIAMSSRWLLEISFARNSSERTGLEEEYQFVLREIFLSLRPMIEADQILGHSG